MNKFSLILLVTIPLLCSGCTSGSANYQMDLFSIISFALAIASLFISCFMAWLSWELYKKSSSSSEKIETSVSKIEVALQNVQNEVGTIVSNVVKHWTNASQSPETSATEIQRLTEKLEELTTQLNSQDSGVEAKGDIAQIQSIIEQQKTEIEKMKNSIVEQKIQSILPSYGSAVNCDQTITEIDSNKQKGVLKVTVFKPIKIATASGKINPPNKDFDDIKIKIVSSPLASNAFSTNYGFGKFNDFHLHLISNSGVPLSGEYIIEYELFKKD